jgi:hypothetical protein
MLLDLGYGIHLFRIQDFDLDVLAICYQFKRPEDLLNICFWPARNVKLADPPK